MNNTTTDNTTPMNDIRTAVTHDGRQQWGLTVEKRDQHGWFCASILTFGTKRAAEAAAAEAKRTYRAALAVAVEEMRANKPRAPFNVQVGTWEASFTLSGYRTVEEAAAAIERDARRHLKFEDDVAAIYDANGVLVAEVKAAGGAAR